MNNKPYYQVLCSEDEPTIRDILTEYMLVSGTDGFSVLSQIRKVQLQIALIMLIASDDENTQMKAFNDYADNNVIKPVSPLVLLKRIETILRLI